MSGWIALSFLNDPLLAKDHFENFYENVGYPISVSRGAYWLAKTYQKLGKQDQAQEVLKDIKAIIGNKLLDEHKAADNIPFSIDSHISLISFISM